MALRLFEHNEKAYRAAIRMMEQYGKAAIVHPTGTGKSYIAFKLIEDNPEKVVIWLSPSEYIFKTQLESLKRNDPEFPLENVHFYTYAKLMCCTQAQLGEIAAQKPAYIILDEFHRAGAECWGESTVALLKLCPDAKLLGLTATNIRYLDNNRDMAEELFDNRVASDMTLGEAVVRGILPAPKYVTTVYQYQKALAKYQARVDNLRTQGIQDVNQKYLDALRRALEQADGLDRVFGLILLGALYLAGDTWGFLLKFLIAEILLSASCKVTLPQHPIWEHMRYVSEIIYFTHMWVAFSYTLIFREFRYYGADIFFASTLIPIILYYILYRSHMLSKVKTIL